METTSASEKPRAQNLEATEAGKDSESAATAVVPDLRDLEKIEPPDGGLRAWMSVVGGWLVTFSTFGYASSFGVFQDLYTLNGAASDSNISWIGSIQLSLLFMLGIISGRLLDAGYFRHIMICGTILYEFSIFMLSLANTSHYYQLLLSQGFGMGIGGGLILVPAISVQAHHWKKRRALAMGITFTGSSIGGIVFPIMLNQLLHGNAGFKWGVRASGFLTLGLLVIANCIMTTRIPKGRVTRPKVNILKTLTDIPYTVAIVGIFLIFWGMFLPYFYLQLFVRLHGVSTTLAFYTLAILNASSTFGRITLNALADIFGPFNMICPVALITGALIFAMFGASNVAGAVVFAIVYGFFSGGYFSLLPPTLSVMSPNLNEVGVRIGVVYFITSFAILTGTPIAGALFKGDHWGKPVAFSGVTVLAGVAFFLLSRHMYAKRRGTNRL